MVSYAFRLTTALGRHNGRGRLDVVREAGDMARLVFRAGSTDGQTFTFDVAVAGSNLAGVIAALEAAQVVEASPRLEVAS